MRLVNLVCFKTKYKSYLHIISSLLGFALFLTLLWLFTRTEYLENKILLIDAVSYCEESPSSATLTTEGISAALDQTLSMPTDCWHPVSLPTHKYAQNFNIEINRPKLQRFWYRFNYIPPLKTDITPAIMIYVPRVIGYAWQVGIDGQIINDNRSEWRSTIYHPLETKIFIPESQLGKKIQVDIGVISTGDAGHSIGRVSIGSVNEIQKQAVWREYLQIVIPQASSAVMLLLGLFFMTFWLSRQTEIEYLLLAFASVIWGIFNLQYALSNPDDQSLNAWYNFLIHNLPIPWLNWLIYLFAAQFANRRLIWLEIGLEIYVIIFSLAVLPFWLKEYEFGLLIIIIYTLVGVLTITIIIWLALVTRVLELYFIAGALFLSAFAGANDLALIANMINPEGYFLIPYCGLLIFAACLHAVQCRYVKAINSQEQLNNNLGERLAEREKELTIFHLRMRELERAQTLADERQRIMHDMHDGLGSSLLSTLAAIEKNPMPQQSVAEALRVCIDDLRLVIDSLEPIDHDLVTLLATIRYRLGQRLNEAGLNFAWDIHELPILAWLEPPDALNVLRLVQEALVNVLKHANATNVRVYTFHFGQQVEICIEDNGVGFDQLNIKTGRGLNNQKKRAEILGGELTLETSLGLGTTVRLRLPLTKI